MLPKTYVITGSASGIGRCLLEKLAGENIIFAGYRTSGQEDFLKSISANIYPFYVDYTKQDTITEACRYIKSECEKIDTLVNIAGCVVAGPAECIDINELRCQFDVNVFGHINLAQQLAEKMSCGKIINVSSMASFGFFPFISPYCASKRSLDILFNAFCIENKKNIKVISIKPGVIATPLWGKSIQENSKYFEKFGEYEKEMAYVIKNAESNEIKGLPAEKVADVIIKADKSKNPKLSYTVGKDAFIANLIAKLPQNIINYIIKMGIKLRCK